jgi:hypothetical protein
VERAQQRHLAGDDLDTVAELRARPHAELGARRFVAERAEADHDAKVAQGGDLTVEERPAGVSLPWQWVVPGRRALDGRRHPGVTELQSVAPPLRRRLVGEPGAVHRPVQPVAGSIPGEHPPGPVGAVRRRGETEHQHPCPEVAEAGHRSRPVLVLAVRRPLDDADLLAPGDEARARPTADHFSGQAAKGGCRHRPVAWQGLMAGIPPTTDG